MASEVVNMATVHLDLIRAACSQTHPLCKDRNHTNNWSTPNKTKAQVRPYTSKFQSVAKLCILAAPQLLANLTPMSSSKARLVAQAAPDSLASSRFKACQDRRSVYLVAKLPIQISSHHLQLTEWPRTTKLPSKIR